MLSKTGIEWGQEGDFYYKQGNYEKALECYKEAYREYPDSPNLSYNIGNTYLKLGQYDNAIKYYKKCLDLKPDYDLAPGQLAEAKRLKELQSITPAPTPAPTPVPTSVPTSVPAGEWYEKGNELLNNGDYNEAIVCYDKAIEIDPEYRDPWYNKGLALAKQSKYEESIECFDKALEIDPDFTPAREAKQIVLKMLK